MAGEIREGLAALRASRAKMLAGLKAEMDEVAGLYDATHKDGLDAVQLVRGEIAAHRQEIQEIRDEFADKSNGGPPGPLPGSAPSSTPAALGASPASNWPDHPSQRQQAFPDAPGVVR